MAVDKDLIISGTALSLDSFSRYSSPWSDDPTTAGGSDVHSRQCSEIDNMANKAISEGVVEEALRNFVAECSFCVTIADPKRPDFPLIAVSDQFEAVTGYSRHEILGKNCRFLNEGCGLQQTELAGLRHSCATGAPFSAVIVNRKKSGLQFMNLLDLRGLTVAQSPSSGEKLWFLVGIQADVSNAIDSEVHEIHLTKFHEVAEAVRIKLTNELTLMALSESITSPRDALKSRNTWTLITNPTWHEPSKIDAIKRGEHLGSRADTITGDGQIDLMQGRKMKAEGTLTRSIVGGLIALSAALSLWKILRPSR